MELILKQIEELKALLQKSELNNKEFFNTNDATEYLDISISHLYKLTSRKEIPFYCPTGKKIYFKKSELDEWITNSRVKSITDTETEVELYLSRNKSV